MSTTLDTPPVIDPSTVSFAPTAIRYGFVGALGLVIYALLGFVTGLSHPTSGLFLSMFVNLLTFVIFIIAMVYGVKKHRNEELDGLITFGRAFIVAFIIVIIMIIISQIFSYIYLNYVDPNYIEGVLVAYQEGFEDLGMDGDDLDDQMEGIESAMTESKTLFGGLLKTLGIGVVVSAIIALIMKKDLSIS